MQYEYLQRAIFCGVLIGILCAAIGVYVVLRGMSFLGVGISHSAIGGTAIGVALGINTLVSSFAFCIIIVWLCGFFSDRGKVRVDSAIGILFSFSQALGIFIFSLTPVFRTDLNSYLFGSIVAIGPSELIAAIIVSLFAFICLFFVYRPLNAMMFDKEFAKVCGLPVSWLNYILLTLVALTVVISMQIVGILLVSALIVIPATAANLICRRMRGTIIISSIFGALSALLGIIISYYLNVSPGPIIVMISSLIFLICFSFSRIR